VVLSVVIICIILVPVGIFLIYLWYETGNKVPKSPPPPPPKSSSLASSSGGLRTGKPYTRVTTSELAVAPTTGGNFKFSF